jgi:pyridinium-3,5-bisthiocarboxylic acid mononucleotide nickel chelatase
VARVLYFDCFSGISGDMVLGALLDAGLPLDALRQALGSLAVSGYEVGTERVLRAGVSATRFVVREEGDVHAHRQDDHEHDHTHDATHPHEHAHAEGDATAHSHGHAHTHSHPHSHGEGQTHTHPHTHTHAHPHVPGHGQAAHQHRSLAEIRALIDRSSLSAAGRARAKAMFQRLGEAEARIHQMPVEQVHLHEVGELDSIIDIVGAVFALEWAGVDRVVCSPLNVGGGMVQSAHGLFPVPAPATLALLGDAPIYAGDVQKELVTPTGALVATTYASSFGPIPPMSIERVGYGAGARDNPQTPNVLRVLIGELREEQPGERVVVIECEIDDMNPQLFGAAMERLYAAGALEVFYVPVQMKKNRPGTLLTVVGTPQTRAVLADVIFRETTTIGLRYAEVARECLRREIVPVETALGPVRFKLAWRDGRVVNAVPEYEDCAALAKSHGLPVKDVQVLAIQAYGGRASAPPAAL